MTSGTVLAGPMKGWDQVIVVDDMAYLIEQETPCEANGWSTNYNTDKMEKNSSLEGSGNKISGVAFYNKRGCPQASFSL